MGKGGRKSLSAVAEGSLNPDLDLKDAVRQRKQKMLKATINSILKLNDESDYASISVLKSDADDKWSEFMHAFEEQEAILIGSGDESLTELTNDFVNMHNSYLKAKIHASGLLSGFDDDERQPAGAAAAAAENRPTFKMAPMRITPFSGESAEWIEFKATCETILDSKFNDVQRLQYLKDALFGEARSLVSHILPGEGAFNIAMKLLKDRYDDQRAIVNAHLKRLYAIPSIVSPTADSFRAMLNTLNGLVAALKCYEIDTTSWDAILIFHITQCFDKATLMQWEDKLDGKRTIPKLRALIDFIQVRITVRQTTDTFTETNQTDKWTKSNKNSAAHKSNTDHKKFGDKFGDKSNEKLKTYFTLKETFACALCGNNHLPSRCNEINRMRSNDLQARIKANRLCENCFYPHPVAECPFKPACKKCDESHNTRLHPENKQMFLNVTDTNGITELQHSLESNIDVANEDDDDRLSVISKRYFYHLNHESDDDDGLLATAIVPVQSDKNSALLHALVDGGSTGNLITVNACKLLNLRFTPLSMPMTGVGDTPVGRVVGRTSVTIRSTYDENYSLRVRVIVVLSIGETKGVGRVATRNWKHLRGLPLANPKYYDSHKFDMLLGTTAHADFIMETIIRGERHQPIATQSRLGWLISGKTNISGNCIATCRATTFERYDDGDDLSNQLKRFWEIEEVSTKKMLTPEEEMAENVFVKSIRRAENGKFVVDLPFKREPTEHLGESFAMAMRRYKSLQRRFEKDPQLKQKYDEVLEEYLTLNHMRLVTNKPTHQCFLPHHAVVKESSTTTKVRTVFDASAKTSSGASLNDCLCVGPVIQPELFDLIIGWRKFQYALSSDIEKMYRMMYVNPEHVQWQTILWHRPGTDGISHYELLTITFGTGSAPFQATRGVYEIGQRLKKTQPELAEIIQSSFYVDDFMRSFPTINEACYVSKSITEELSKYGFNVRKWKSNDPDALKSIDEVDCEQSIDFDSTFKTLGIAWHASTDTFIFKPFELKGIEKWTKRRILSVIAKLFDPLGWLAPCIVRAKLLMQDIWRLPNNINWDDQVPPHIENQWQQILNDLIATNPIKIPRWLRISTVKESIELHVFCDASMLSYACCVYVRVTKENGTSECNLLAAKTKVAPVRTITIPRLELCGALLAAKLARRCSSAFNDASIIAWCDSKIVLAWLATHPSKWNTFVQNRTKEIHDNINAICWRYIPTKKNPADIASRGSKISEVEQSSLWWHGPSFLTTPSEKAPNENYTLPIESAPEKRKQAKTYHVILPKENSVLEKFENFIRLLYFTCFAFRWMHKRKGQQVLKGPITAEEMEKAETHWIRLTQLHYFGHEIGKLKANRPVPMNSMLLKLNPFIDTDGILRMNGRVSNPELISQKTSIILPSKSRFVLLLMRHAHEQQAKHGGVQLTLRTLRNRFWIIHARSQVNKLIGRCIACYRSKKHLIGQQMADLPPFRTLPAEPFTFTGCDFAGPFSIKLNETRNASTTKGYVALFICLTTKAVHFEVVGDMSTAEYLMALENFIARRGIPSTMYTDNGTNFVGGEKEIRELHAQFMSQTNAITRMFATNRIKFKRIPARAAHMGGIWERAVGLMKTHLVRVMNNTKLTMRRFDHVLKQIECSLNSRPLWAITHNADDIEVITPSHFSHFKPINTLPRPDISHIKMNRLDQYQHLQRLYQDFWKSWSKEYVDQLQIRQKWQKEKPNIKIGSIVVIAEDNLPPSRWSLGRVVATYPDKKGLVRVVDVKCGDSTLKRPIHRLGLLPILDNDQLNAPKNAASNAGEHVEEFSTII